MKLLPTQLLSFTLASLIALAACMASSQVYSQETRYIRDTLYVPLRSGQSFQHRIVHKGLVSGTPLALIELSEDKSYSHVKTQKGIEGWIQTQYLSDTPSARSQLEALTKQMSQLKSQTSKAKQELATLKKQYNDAKLTVNTLTQSQQASSTELADIKAISANAISLDSDNKVLLQQTQELQNSVDMLNSDNQRLNDNLDNSDFLNGAFAVLIGVFITLLVPRLWPSKSSEWA